jgi:hypothetical protein
VNVPNDDAHRHIYARVKARIDAGATKQTELLNRVNAMVIRDKLVDPKKMVFDGGSAMQLKIGYCVTSHPSEWFDVHRHALSQLCQKVKIPAAIVTELNRFQDGDDKPEWGYQELAQILNTFYANKTFKERGGRGVAFLHRLVGTELRGFLSRRFNRHLASAVLLDAFIDACDRVTAAPIEATITAVKVMLKCYQPFVYEPIPGEYICLGAEWSNSDFGSGRMQVCTTVWRVTSDTYATLDHSISRVHIGSVIEDSDVEMSDETAYKEAEAQASAINDTVCKQLSKDSVENLLYAIEAAHSEDIPWARLRSELSRFMSKKEVDGIKDLLNQGILDLPPVRQLGQEKVANRWWASNAVAWLANKTEDLDRKAELEHQAGALLDIKEE